MIRARLPLPEFLDVLRLAGTRAGRHMLMAFVAREADCPHLFAEIARFWSSLHDVMAGHILFVVIDTSKSRPFNLEDHSVLGNDGLLMWNQFCRLSEELRDASRDPELYEEFIEAHRDSSSPDSSWSAAHTLGVASLRDALDGVTESDVPCIYFELLQAGDPISSLVPLREAPDFSVYGFAKMVVERCGHSLRQLKAQGDSLRATKTLDYSRALESGLWIQSFLADDHALSDELRDCLTALVDARIETDQKGAYELMRPLVDSPVFSTLRKHVQRLIDAPLGETDRRSLCRISPGAADRIRKQLHDSSEEIVREIRSLFEACRTGSNAGQEGSSPGPFTV